MATLVADVIDLTERRARKQREEPIVLTSVGETRLSEIMGKPTRECRANPLWGGDRYDVPLDDSWLPVNQPTAAPCIVTALTPSRIWNPIEAAVTILRKRISMARLSLHFVGLSIIRAGYVFTLPQVGALIEMTERGEKTGIPVDGRGTLFFMGTGSPLGPISVGCVRRSQPRCWPIRLYTTDTPIRELTTALNANVLVPDWSPLPS